MPQKAVMMGAVGLTFEDLKELFPDRVLLARLDDIFTAWKASHDSLPSNKQVSMTYPTVGTQARILYDYDHYTYRSTVAPIEINGAPQIEIKLSNDGFIYPSHDSLSLNDTYDSTKTHHKRTGWARLSDETIKTHFGSLIAGAKSIMGATGELVDGQVLYHEYEERVDFLFQKKNGTARILITFQPGFPEHFHKDDPWGEF
mmetsp:Transcript_206/g.664  ORF Transcript_206/g.664 Transcript_206/m.664 type:complete len:201 (+) Transcript_206:275-877(+)